MGKGFASNAFLCIIISVLLSMGCNLQPNTSSKTITMTDKLQIGNISSFNTVKYSDLKDKLHPSVQLWINEEARRISDYGVSASALYVDIQSRFQSQMLQSPDIEALAILVMIQAVQNEEDEIREILDELHATNEAKEKLRQLIEYMNEQQSNEAKNELRARFNDINKQQKESADVSWSEWSDYYSQANSALARVDPKYKLTIPIIVNERARTSNYDEINNRFDDMNELSEMTALRLQLAQDRRSKFIETLSNIMKKDTTTQDTLIQNLK